MVDDDIDIVGVVRDNTDHDEKRDDDDKELENTKSKIKNGLYGPDQFSEEDVLAVVQEMEKDDPADNDITDDEEGCQKRWCSQCQGSCSH